MIRKDVRKLRDGHHHFERAPLEQIPLTMQPVESDCVLFYTNALGERVFLAKLVRGVLRDPIAEAQLREFVQGKPFDTYNCPHTPETTAMHDRIAAHAADVVPYFSEGQAPLEKSSHFHFFYNKEMYIHRDYRYKRLRSLNVVMSPTVTGYFVFSDFDLYVDLRQGDLLLFDASQYHYMRRTENVSEEHYRLALNML